jgi:hypothetical protein
MYIEPPADEVVVVGTITAEGVECPALRAEDGTLYTLTGLPRKVSVGERLQVVGRTLLVSTCQQGITIGVTWIAPAVEPRGALEKPGSAQ